MKLEEYEVLRERVNAVLDKSDLSVPAINTATVRDRWDALYLSGALETAYKTGLNDAHIDTALKKIFREYKREEKPNKSV